MNHENAHNEKESPETGLLEELNDFLKHNAKARRLQTKFENSLAAFIGFERADLSTVMDTYIDLDIAGARSATIEQLREIIIEAISDKND